MGFPYEGFGFTTDGVLFRFHIDGVPVLWCQDQPHASLLLVLKSRNQSFGARINPKAGLLLVLKSRNQSFGARINPKACPLVVVPVYHHYKSPAPIM